MHSQSYNRKSHSGVNSLEWLFLCYFLIFIDNVRQSVYYNN
nr:MAG TPA: hypothetical protein [Caudoviricetes sp.]